MQNNATVGAPRSIPNTVPICTKTETIGVRADSAVEDRVATYVQYKQPVQLNWQIRIKSSTSLLTPRDSENLSSSSIPSINWLAAILNRPTDWMSDRIALSIAACGLPSDMHRIGIRL